MRPVLDRKAQISFNLEQADVVLNRPRVLLAEDDDELRSLLATTLRRDGFEVVEAHDGPDLLRVIGEEILRAQSGSGIDLVVSDIRMPGLSGLNVLAGLRRADWSTPVILITGFGDRQTHEEARRLGASAVLDKPFDLDLFRSTVLELAGALAEPAR